MMAGKIEKIVTPDADKLAAMGASIFFQSAAAAVDHKGHFTVAISGGSTPVAMHRLFTQEPYMTQIPWHRTHLFWVDERLVPFDHPHSNFGTARKDFVDNVPIPPGHVHPMPVTMPPVKGASSYAAELKFFFKRIHLSRPQFDLITLGIGEDGHIASIFPGHDSTPADKWVLSVKGGTPNLYRMTLTFAVLNEAKRILFLASGKKKAKMVKTVFENRQTHLPASHIRPLNGTVTWLLDKDAASLLQEKNME